MEKVKENIIDKVGKENATDYMTTIRNFCDYLKDEDLADEKKSIILIVADKQQIAGVLLGSNIEIAKALASQMIDNEDIAMVVRQAAALYMMNKSSKSDEEE